MKIAIDIGHARHTGASGNGLEEHEVCAAIADALADKLASAGHITHVVDFPDSSNKADLVATVREVNSLRPDVSISLHTDCADNASAHGAHVCFFPSSKKGAAVADSIARPLCKLLPGRASATVPRGDLYVLKNTACPAVLVECGFISNAHDSALMRSSPVSIATAIADGLLSYFDSES